MTFPLFLKENTRWLLGGFPLTPLSSFGQAYFVSLSAGAVRGDLGLSHGVTLPLQIGFMGVYCLAASLLMLRVAQRIRARATSPRQLFGHDRRTTRHWRPSHDR